MYEKQEMESKNQKKKKTIEKIVQKPRMIVEINQN